MTVPNLTVCPYTGIAWAVVYARRARHHPDCHCNQHRAADGAGYCNAYEATWTTAIDRLLDRIMAQQTA